MALVPYARINPTSPITHCEIGSDFVKAKYDGGLLYTYTYGSAGISAVDEMKKYAKAGKGLSTYISKNKPPYSSKS